MKKLVLSVLFILSLVWVFLYLEKTRTFLRPIVGSSNIELLFNSFLFFGLLLPLVLFLCISPAKYFTAWWKFARFGLPLTIAGIVYVNLTYDSGLFGFGAGFDLLLIGGCYLFFIFGTLVQLIRTWWKGRKSL